MLIDVYGGPGVQRVANTWGSLFHQYLAQHGYVVFSLDNRGSGLRGTRSRPRWVCAWAMSRCRISWRACEFLRGLPFVDAKRIGIFGWSYGGYMALMCLMQAPDSFAAGVAGAPVTDWALYDTHYTERYLSTPAANAAGYARKQRARRTRTSCSARCCWCTAWPTTTCCSRTAPRS